jgi:hypothetical protein
VALKLWFSINLNESRLSFLVRHLYRTRQQKLRYKCIYSFFQVYLNHLGYGRSIKSITIFNFGPKKSVIFIGWFLPRHSEFNLKFEDQLLILNKTNRYIDFCMWLQYIKFHCQESLVSSFWSSFACRIRYEFFIGWTFDPNQLEMMAMWLTKRQSRP